MTEFNKWRDAVKEMPLSNSDLRRLADQRYRQFVGNREVCDLTDAELEQCFELLDDGSEHYRTAILEPARRLFALMKTKPKGGN